MSQVQAPEMSCKEMVEVITEYLEGGLPAGEVARFEAHLAACDGCEAYLDQMRQTIAALGRLPPEPLPPEVESKFLAVFQGWQRGR